MHSPHVYILHIVNIDAQLTTDPNRRPFKLILDDAADQSMIGSRTNLGSYEDNTVDKKLTHLLDPHTRMEDPCLVGAVVRVYLQS